MTTITVCGRFLPVFGFCLAFGLYGQQSVPNQNQLQTTVPRLVRISNNFHPANGLSLSPVEGVTLSIYREETGGIPLWQETQNVSVDAEGRYTVMMGSTLADGVPLELFTSSEPRWLGVQFQRQGETEQPRVRLASVPYALKAADAETLAGRPASAYLLNPAAVGADASASSGGVSGVPNMIGGANSFRPKPKVDAGTINCIAAFTSGTDVGCSPMWQSGTSVGLNTTTPLATLDVQSNTAGFTNLLNLKQANTSGVGATGMTITNQNAQMLMRAYTAGAPGLLSNSIGWFALNGSNKLFIGHAGGSVGNDVQFFTNNQWNNPQMTLTQAGNLGVGTTTPGFKLDVAGPMNAVNTITSGFANGLQGAANSSSGAGVYGTNSTTGAGVWGNNTAGSGFAVGVLGTTTSPLGAGIQGNSNQGTGVGVSGNNTATSGLAPGVSGQTSSTNGAGVFGSATAVTGNANGVQGTTSSATGAGVQGFASVAGAFGVHGTNTATTGYAVGVQGNISSTNGAGVHGVTNSATAVGVQGNNNASTGYAVAVQGNTASSGGVGVQGNANNGGGFGVVGFNNSTTGFAIGTQGASSSSGGTGLLGQSMSCGQSGCGLVNGTALTLAASSDGGGTLIEGRSGVQGSNAFGGTEVFRVDGMGAGTFKGGVEGDSTTVLPSGNPGVVGLNGATSGLGVGTAGVSFSPDGAGMAGLSATCNNSGCALINGTAGMLYTSNTGGYLLKGLSAASGSDFTTATQVFSVDGAGNGSYAGTLNVGGNLVVTGSVTKGGGSFRIDHPLDPENKYLYHSFVESPDMMNIYNGIVLLDEHGEATVTLPDWFEALNEDFRYQLTCVGGYAPVYVGREVAGNQFQIAGGRPGLKVSWQITGIRHDAYANAHRIPVEVEKPAAERGATAPSLSSGGTGSGRQ